MELSHLSGNSTYAGKPRLRKFTSSVLWYVLLVVLAVGTTLPFLWIFLTSLKGPTDTVFSVPLQFLPQAPTLDNYVRAWNLLPISHFFVNSIVVSLATCGLNVLVCSMAAYPLAKMKFKGSNLIFYLLLATLVVPVQLTYIPSFVLAVNFFHYYDSIQALVLPNMASAFNIFLLRQAFKAVPNDLIEAARMDGANELRTWWSVVLPVVRPSLATVAILSFVTSWNDFLWPSLMLHTRENMTLPVGLAALQGQFVSDFRAVAAGVGMTVIPIMIFFIIFQRYFVRGLGGAVKG